MNTIIHFLVHHPLIFVACVWLIGGGMYSWFESRAGMNNSINGEML